VLDKSQVAYESPAEGQDHCAQCEHWRVPNRCEVVGGKIKPGDWCELFVAWEGAAMPVTKGPLGVDQEMSKFKSGTLHSGSPKGPVVTNRKQAVAIALSEAGMSNKQRGKRRFKI
jgi:hypothetical protein